SSTDISDESKMEWGYFVSDFFFTGLIGLAVDGADGAMFYHNQTMVTAHLDPVAPLPSTAASAPTSTSVAQVQTATIAPQAESSLAHTNQPTMTPAQPVPHAVR
ncbi:MAG TPA: hypothetical protein VMT58_01170, partial [Candidatus Binataceae bacterium]|nr:hypothetical protein [Candidatus Binataceae bacterium]